MTELTQQEYILKLMCAKEGIFTNNFFQLHGKARISLLAAGASTVAQAAHGEGVKDHHTELGSVSR